MAIGNTPLLKKGSEEPLFLVNKFVLFCAESRQTNAIAVTSLGYDVELIDLGFLVVSHNRNFFGGY